MPPIRPRPPALAVVPFVGFLLVVAACPSPGILPDEPTPGEPTEESPDPTPPDPTPPPTPRTPWIRDEERAPGSVTLTELLYDAPGAGEWVELHNPMALDMDLSHWSLRGAVEFTFDEGTILPAGGYLVVAGDPALLPVPALGPWSGELDDQGERVDLFSNGGRRMDTVHYGADAPWPVAPSGSGASLAKIHATAASDRAEHWSWSRRVGGSPGAPNALDPAAPPLILTLLAEDSSWRWESPPGSPDPDWMGLDFDDSGWPLGPAPFFAGPSQGSSSVTLRVTADNYHAVYTGAADGSGLTLVASDLDGDWTTVESIPTVVAPQDHLFIAAWEAPWDYGGPQMLIAEAEGADGVLGTGADHFEWVLGPPGHCPGAGPPDPPPPVAELQDLITAGAWALPPVEADRASSPWGWALQSAFDAATHYVWVDTLSDTSLTNVDNTYALFRSTEPIAGSPGTTELPSPPTTVRFRT